MEKERIEGSSRNQRSNEALVDPPTTMIDLDLDMIGRMFAQKMANSNQDRKPANESHTAKPAVENKATSKTKDLYDPSNPNNYELVLRERQEQIEEQREKQLQDEYLLRVQLYGQSGKPAQPEEMVPIMDDSNALIDRKIIRMLEKHGWEYGKGIGLQEDGIKNPLVAVKTSGSTAVIKPSEDAVGESIIGMPQKKLYIANQAGQPPQGQSATVLYQSAPVVDDPRIKPIQDKYFRTYYFFIKGYTKLLEFYA